MMLSSPYITILDSIQHMNEGGSSNNMDVKFIYTTTEHLDELPITDGQLIVLTDENAIYYDIEGERHRATAIISDDLVTTNTEQVITGAKRFSGLTHISTLTQGAGCSADEGDHAEGLATSARGTLNYSHAEGLATIASGRGSHAEGERTLAEGTASHATGCETEAVGDYSSTSGILTYALGTASSASGAVLTAVRDNSRVIGQGNLPMDEDLFEVGNGTVFDENGELLDEEHQVKSNAMRVTQDGRILAQADVEIEGGKKLSDSESTLNKVTVLSKDSTHLEYPSAKSVVDLLNQMVSGIIKKDEAGIYVEFSE